MLIIKICIWVSDESRLPTWSMPLFSPLCSPSLPAIMALSASELSIPRRAPCTEFPPPGGTGRDQPTAHGHTVRISLKLTERWFDSWLWLIVLWFVKSLPNLSTSYVSNLGINPSISRLRFELNLRELWRTESLDVSFEVSFAAIESSHGGIRKSVNWPWWSGTRYSPFRSKIMLSQIDY